MTSEKNSIVLVVDDDMNNRKILHRLLSRGGYQVMEAEDGQDAWEQIQSKQHRFDAIILDRMMPRLDGIGLLLKLKESDRLKNIPVIMQTAAGASHEVKEGIDAGVYYYLIKPFDHGILMSLVDAAIEEQRKEHMLQQDLRQSEVAMGSIRMAQWVISTYQEVYNLSFFLAHYFPEEKKAARGIYELLMNALEHGNLGVGYDEKSNLLLQGTKHWQQEIIKRQNLPEHKGKVIDVRYARDDDEVKLYIKDVGKGFDWRPYIELDPKRVTDTHGRGIAIACKSCFDEVEYLGAGNEVMVIAKSK